MGLARHHDLERMPRSDPGQPVEVAEDQHRPLVAGHAPREAKDGSGGIEGYASARLDAGDEAVFGGLMAPPDLAIGRASRREHVWPKVESLGVPGLLKHKQHQEK